MLSLISQAIDGIQLCSFTGMMYPEKHTDNEHSDKYPQNCPHGMTGSVSIREAMPLLTSFMSVTMKPYR